jgi:hypothetical protein
MPFSLLKNELKHESCWTPIAINHTILPHDFHFPSIDETMVNPLLLILTIDESKYDLPY